MKKLQRVAVCCIASESSALKVFQLQIHAHGLLIRLGGSSRVLRWLQRARSHRCRLQQGHCWPVSSCAHPTAVTERWDALWGDLQLALASPEMCELCITPVSLRPAMVNPWKQPYQNCEKMPAFPAIFFLKLSLTQNDFKAAVQITPWGFLRSPATEQPASGVEGWCLWGFPCRSGQPLAALVCGEHGPEHGLEVLVCKMSTFEKCTFERNSIYFVQGRIPSHSEQIYYKSVLP